MVTLEYGGEFQQRSSFGADNNRSSQGTVLMSSGNTRGACGGSMRLLHTVQKPLKSAAT